MSVSALLLYFRIFVSEKGGEVWWRGVPGTGNKKVGFYQLGNPSQNPQEKRSSVHRRKISSVIIFYIIYQTNL
jgi:hypothetical protein